MSNDVFTSKICYSGSHQSTSWRGYAVDDKNGFVRFLHSVVRSRITDEESGFEPFLRGLATTGMATDRIERLLNAVPIPKSWEIGEAFAESILQTISEWRIYWPWNTARDRRTPQASLPGADLIGFCEIGKECWLVIGEVKTSSEANAPPSVMQGRSGMAWQLEHNVKSDQVQVTLLQWLFVRCKDNQFKDMYEKAVGLFLSSGKILVIGALIRDTQPNESDLYSRGRYLGRTLPVPIRVELFAWYLPVPIEDWPALLHKAMP